MVKYEDLSRTVNPNEIFPGSVIVERIKGLGTINTTATELKGRPYQEIARYALDNRSGHMVVDVGKAPEKERVEIRSANNRQLMTLDGFKTITITILGDEPTLMAFLKRTKY